MIDIWKNREFITANKLNQSINAINDLYALTAAISNNRNSLQKTLHSLLLECRTAPPLLSSNSNINDLWINLGSSLSAICNNLTLDGTKPKGILLFGYDADYNPTLSALNDNKQWNFRNNAGELLPGYYDYGCAFDGWFDTGIGATDFWRIYGAFLMSSDVDLFSDPIDLSAIHDVDNFELNKAYFAVWPDDSIYFFKDYFEGLYFYPISKQTYNILDSGATSHELIDDAIQIDGIKGNINQRESIIEPWEIDLLNRTIYMPSILVGTFKVNVHEFVLENFSSVSATTYYCNVNLDSLSAYVSKTKVDDPLHASVPVFQFDSEKVVYQTPSEEEEYVTEVYIPKVRYINRYPVVPCWERYNITI